MSEIPPPPPPKNSRKHPRFAMFASVEVHAGDETVILPAHNISLGGVYLTADGHDLGEFTVGLEVEVLIFDALNDAKDPLQIRARVVRRDAVGIALMWSDDDPKLAIALAGLLERLRSSEATRSSSGETPG
jgi:hypothetical protein